MTREQKASLCCYLGFEGCFVTDLLRIVSCCSLLAIDSRRIDSVSRLRGQQAWASAGQRVVISALAWRLSRGERARACVRACVWWDYLHNSTGWRGFVCRSFSLRSQSSCTLKDGPQSEYQTRHLGRVPLTGAPQRRPGLSVLGVREETSAERPEEHERAAAGAGPRHPGPGETGPGLERAGARGERRG